MSEDFLYAREKSFKLKVTSKDKDGFEVEATLEGCYLHEPLTSLIIGRCYNKVQEQENFNFAF